MPVLPGRYPRPCNHPRRGVLELARAIKGPAWPTLLGLQLVVVGALVGVQLRIEPSGPEPAPLEEQLIALDLPASEAALSSALESVAESRALPLGSERRAQSFLSLAAHGAELDVVGVDLVVAPPSQGLSHVDATVEVRGDLYDLPVFVDGLHHQTAIVLVEGLAVEGAAGGEMTARLIVRYLRPDAGNTDWIDARLVNGAPGADSAGPVLSQAATLLAWRQFEARLPSYEVERDTRWESLMRELPAALIGLREQGGNIRWSPEEGLRVRG